MNNLRIKTRIFLSVGVLGVEFLTFLLVAQWCDLQTQQKMKVAAESQFPAAVGLEQAEASFQRLTKRYNDAVLMQDRNSIAQSGNDAQEVLNELDGVEAKAAYSPERQQQIHKVRQEIAETEPKARDAYSTMLGDTITDQVQDSVMQIARQHQQIVAELKNASQGVAIDFSAQLASVTTLTTFQGNVGWGMLLIVMVCGVLVAWTIDRKVLYPLADLVERLRDIATGEGDLTKRLEMGSLGGNEIAEASHWFNTFMDKLQHLVLRVLESSEHLTGATELIVGDVGQIADVAQKQRQSMMMMSVAMQQMTDSMAQVSTSTNTAASNATEAGVLAQSGGVRAEAATNAIYRMEESAEQTRKRIEQVGHSAKEIGRIVNVIDEIAGQTNLLALNAAIEAAHAGENGRGFAVVAGEVRELAVRTTNATAEISQMIVTIQNDAKGAVDAIGDSAERVHAAVQDVTQTSDALQKIILSADHVQAMVMQIAMATTEQSATVREVSNNMEKISSVAEMSATSAVDSSAGCSQLAQLAQGLRQLVGIFKVDSKRKSRHDPKKTHSAQRAA
jgi:methyl-accepting chemotaxis protein